MVSSRAFFYLKSEKKLKKWIKKLAILTAVAVSSIYLTGCASIVNGTHEKFVFDSKPTHAMISVDGNSTARTPAQVSLKRNSNHTVRISLPHYQAQTITLTQSVNGWMFGNLLFGGLIGIVIDATDGAMYKLTPSQMNVYAEKSGVKYKADSRTFTVFLAHKADKSWKKIGKLHKA